MSRTSDRTTSPGATSTGCMEIEEVARQVRRAVVQTMCEAMALPTQPRPVVEALDQYLGAALIGQRVIEILGLDTRPEVGPRSGPDE